MCVVCTNGEAKLCARCRSVAYCGTQCQRRDWPTHKHDCTPAQPLAEAAAAPTPTGEEKDDEVDCASYYADCTFRTGNEDEEKAYTTMRKMLKSERCVVCLAASGTGEEYLVCGVCYHAHYCSPACRGADRANRQGSRCKHGHGHPHDTRPPVWMVACVANVMRRRCHELEDRQGTLYHTKRLVSAMRELGWLARATALATRVVANARDPREQASAHIALGQVWASADMCIDAFKAFRAALECARDAHDDTLQADAALSMTRECLAIGDVGAAYRAGRSVFKLSASDGGDQFKRHAGAAAACCLLAESKHEQALPMFEAELVLAVMAGDKRKQAAAHVKIGECATGAGLFERGASSLSAAVDMFMELGVLVELPGTLFKLGANYSAEGDHERSLLEWRRGIAVASSIGKQGPDDATRATWLGRLYLATASSFMVLGDFSSARSETRKAYDQCSVSESLVLVGEVLTREAWFLHSEQMAAAAAGVRSLDVIRHTKALLERAVEITVMYNIADRADGWPLDARTQLHAVTSDLDRMEAAGPSQ